MTSLPGVSELAQSAPIRSGRQRSTKSPLHPETMTSTDPLWRALARTLDLPPDEAQLMALRLRAHGIETWEQWLAAGEVIA